MAHGFTPEQALAEAKRCLNCKKPLCVEGCPVEVEIPSSLPYWSEGSRTKPLPRLKRKIVCRPSVAGFVPRKTSVKSNVFWGGKGEPVAIGALERYCADWGRANEAVEPTCAPSCAVKGKVAVVGSGPAGLTAAADLALMGYKVTLLNRYMRTGGVLRYGIPEFRLPKTIVDYEVGNLEKLGVEIQTNVLIGKTITIDELFATGYQAVFIGTGAGLPYFLQIPGENLNGVYSANEFLTRVNLMKAYLFPEHDTPIRIGKRVAVVGAGNVAMDSARTALRLGAETVSIVYRRSREEMPARLEEIENAEEEGVEFRLLTNPVRLEGDENGNLTTMICQKMSLGEPDASGRRRPVPIPGSEEALPVDTVIVAVGQGPNPILLQGTTGLNLNKRGYIEVDPETMMTSIPGVFAGGDIVTGAATVIAAMGAGKKAARAIDQYLTAKNNPAKE